MRVSSMFMKPGYLETSQHLRSHFIGLNSHNKRDYVLKLQIHMTEPNITLKIYVT